MSFSFETKRELSSVPLADDKESYALCYGLMLFSKQFTYDEIVFTTENKYINECLKTVLTKLYCPMIESLQSLKLRNSKNQLITTRLINSEDCNRIYESFGYSKGDVTLRLNRANITDEKELSAFLRGAFMSCGSVSNPEKNYHLEFKVPYRNLANDLLTLLCEVEPCALKPKSVTRQGHFIVYFKDSEQIADFLTYIGATNSAMEIMGAKALKQVRNITVRKVNSELHNLKKTVDASAKQTNAILKLMKSDKYKTLSPELKEMAQLRLDNPDMSLRDLGELTSDKISRSGVNHRLKKLMSYIE